MRPVWNRVGGRSIFGVLFSGGHKYKTGRRNWIGRELSIVATRQIKTFWSVAVIESAHVIC